MSAGDGDEDANIGREISFDPCHYDRQGPGIHMIYIDNKSIIEELRVAARGTNYRSVINSGGEWKGERFTATVQQEQHKHLVEHIRHTIKLATYPNKTPLQLYGPAFLWSEVNPVDGNKEGAQKLHTDRGLLIGRQEQGYRLPHNSYAIWLSLSDHSFLDFLVYDEVEDKYLRMIFKVPKGLAILHNAFHSGSDSATIKDSDNYRFFAYVDNAEFQSGFQSRLLGSLLVGANTKDKVLEGIWNHIPTLREFRERIQEVTGLQTQEVVEITTVSDLEDDENLLNLEKEKVVKNNIHLGANKESANGTPLPTPLTSANDSLAVEVTDIHGVMQETLAEVLQKFNPFNRAAMETFSNRQDVPKSLTSVARACILAHGEYEMGTTSSTLSADDFVPFNPPIEYQRCRDVIRNTFDDLPEFEFDAVLLISKLASDTIERLVSTAYDSAKGSSKDGGVPTITASALKDVVDNDMLMYGHFEDLVDNAKLEPALPSSGFPTPDLGPPTASLTVPFSPAIDVDKTARMIRSSFPDLPHFSTDSVALIGALVADQVKDIVESAYGMAEDEVREDGVKMKRIEMDDIKEAVLKDTKR